MTRVHEISLEVIVSQNSDDDDDDLLFFVSRHQEGFKSQYASPSRRK